MSWLKRLWQRIRLLVPFGILVANKPRHYLEMLRVLWENRGRWGYALRILKHGVCDGCSLGPRGLRDDVIPGVHLCLTRLKLLRLNTMGPVPDAALGDVDALRALGNDGLHRLGRVPYPLLRRQGDRGFTRFLIKRSGWSPGRCEGRPDAMGMFVTSRGLTNETYTCCRSSAPGRDAAHRQLRSTLPRGLDHRAQRDARVRRAHALASDWIGTDSDRHRLEPANNHPVSTKYMRAAKLAGTRIAVVNPFREPALERYWSRAWLPPRVGTALMDDYFECARAATLRS